MRNGVNPEKFKNEMLPVFMHRIVVPVYIPNLHDAYYRNQYEVFEKFLNRLIKTINPQTTAITLINNNSCEEISRLIENRRTAIDKLVRYHDNKGKVFPVLQEARAAAEAFITITDADVLFYEGWERAVFKVFALCPKAGVVAPLPSPALAFYENTAVFSDRYLTSGIAYQKVMSDADVELYLAGMGNDSLLNRENRKYSWKERQYVLKNVNALIGCGHFVATYRNELFEGKKNQPLIKFKNGLEQEFIDSLSDEKGYYRLSTVKTYAYHMANNLDEHSRSFSLEKENKVSENLIQRASYSKRSLLPWTLRKLAFKIIKRLFKL
ncbi:glycosyltransferase family A protein [Leeuwenhoekiella sp. ZYFB001]|uniref:glycosyltransferase family A protein n=1 Tax=Leeuwenhoekiella sp. ZYFB001 TaxID=2719912 RepID=UPI001431F292|nr:glycosyltransferase family A protein [Leeuwenhoekiella sp. ZYFB001]